MQNKRKYLKSFVEFYSAHNIKSYTEFYRRFPLYMTSFRNLSPKVLFPQATFR
jgi:hypothetical protein